jgi:phosphate transport system substrate-binding protein
MAFSRGRCTNFDYCAVAESRRDVEIPVGEAFICPECGKPLKVPASSRPSALLPAVIGLVLLLLVGGAVYVGLRVAGTPVSKPPVARAEAPAPAAVPAPVRRVAAAVTLPPPPPPPAVPAETVLARLGGAPGMLDGLVAPLAAAYLTQIGDTGVATETHGRETRVSGLRGGQRETIVLSADGEMAGFSDMAQGKADLVAAPRRIEPPELTLLRGLGDMKAPQAEHVLAVNAEAVIVNPANQLAALSPERVRQVLAGTIKNGAVLGGTPGPIDVYTSCCAPQGAPGSVVPADASPVGRQLNDGAAVTAAVLSDPHGFGVVELPFVGQARAVPVGETGATPVNPTDHAAVVAGGYPFTRRLYLYTSPKADSVFAQRFVDYALSPAGQAIVEQNGLIPATLKAPLEAAPAPAPAPMTELDKFKAFVAGSKRLAIVFHFQPRSTVVDALGERDLARVKNYLVSIHDGGDHLLLAGFADNQGDPESNLAVSKQRADAVAALFIQQGLTPGKVAGFGSALPVADNGTEAGRERNRRVEVYVKP